MKVGNIELTELQTSAVQQLQKGNILVGGVGSGKTYSSIAWAKPLVSFSHLYVITTAMNRNKGEWHRSIEECGITEYTVDSWNNIEKYKDVKNAVFIFDEQRVVGYGKWSKIFIRIAWNNDWILTTATPGDNWLDYIPVFIANKFYRNKTEFTGKHVEWNPHTPFPSVKRFHDVHILEEYRDRIVVTMNVKRHTRRRKHYSYCDYDLADYQDVCKTYLNPFTERPIESASEFSMVLRRIVAESEDRQNKVLELIRSIDRLIIFYNYTFELELLRQLAKISGKDCYEYNGQKHEFVPAEKEGQWVYLVQYTAGAEGWNCISTDSMVFYSVNHSYKKMEQAQGRIDRMNTSYTDLHYYVMSSHAKIDKDTLRVVSMKKQFNDALWVKKNFGGFYGTGE